MSRAHCDRARRHRPLLLLVSLAVACSALAVTVAPGGAQSAGKVDKAAVLRFGVPIEENGGVYFDPATLTITGNPTARLWTDLIYDTMIHNTPDGKGAPGLATKWTTPDPSTVELTLRDGAKYSDGTPVTAAAIKAAWDRTVASPRPNKPDEVQSITAIEAPDAKTVRIRLSKPIAKQFINNELRSSNFMGTPAPSSIAAGTVNSKPVGAGPYMLDSYSTGRLVLKKNPNFYDPKAQKLAGIEFINMSQGQPAVSALQAGTVDLIWSIPPDSIQALEGAGFDITTTPSERSYQIALCGTAGVFASKEARQALQYALDRDAINEGALAGTGQPSLSPVPPQSPYFDKAAVKGIKHDPKKAKALLKKAGVAPGTSVKAIVAAQQPFSTVAEIVQQQLKDVGLDMQITASTNIVSDINALRPDMAIVTMEPSRFSMFFTKTPGPTNWCNNYNAELEAAYTTTLDSSKSEQEITAAYKTMQKLIADESTNVVLNMLGLLAAHTANVRGLAVINSPYGPMLNTVYMVQG
jgi:peptide/nickel transport system substrate-binding protein